MNDVIVGFLIKYVYKSLMGCVIVLVRFILWCLIKLLFFFKESKKLDVFDVYLNYF